MQNNNPHIIIAVQSGLQTLYVGGRYPSDAITNARAQGIPEHLLRAGVLYHAANINLPRWIDAADRAAKEAT